ncbi:16S rRNA (cytidine(1402)-2'-O)-methyltransferase [Helicobacter cappadocius]|uniref:Ribosomal RNA small subunit methyltransferase I n=1 Tax=Helicobacter cappadocius TaxID=3063998 RepID=A0AA90PL23_9HELI|nr:MULTISPECIES: 16S rRNA (cytidine(1402)-2'-O)-methyltransferase [unclassified Helicobacter]MDO7252946.1 16S rRNA (cytidine(1402)-2'-O)-methyltransferase [Helicobacter sp. faydin-H75]MDP2539064.1 16S rRNA (cytidine(1402)-2'-O)-methyltransferase [Helicobacter sp. faydin-H76]
MLTLLPTPIGNLADITLRSLQVLADSDVIMCEDVRVGKKLISLLEKNSLIKDNFPKIFDSKQFIPFHSHNEKEFLDSIHRGFFEKNIVFISDAGMPCVSDPGMSLVAYAMSENIPYDVLPGVSASVSAYCFSGIVSDGFLFAGFLPHKQKDRKERIANLMQGISILQQDVVIVVYESPHRILDSLGDIVCLYPNIHLFAIKEMTKLHQKFFYGKAVDVLEEIKKVNTNGEWVLVMNVEKKIEPSLTLAQISQMDIPPKVKAKILAKLENKDIKSIYERICKEGQNR